MFLKIYPLANGHVAQGNGKGMHETPYVLHEGEEKSPYGEGRKEKECAMLEAYVAPYVCYVGIHLSLSKVLQS